MSTFFRRFLCWIYFFFKRNIVIIFCRIFSDLIHSELCIRRLRYIQLNFILHDYFLYYENKDTNFLTISAKSYETNFWKYKEMPYTR